MDCEGKKRLVKESGVDAEYLRLYCRALSNRHNEHAERRFAQLRGDYYSETMRKEKNKPKNIISIRF